LDILTESNLYYHSSLSSGLKVIEQSDLLWGGRIEPSVFSWRTHEDAVHHIDFKLNDAIKWSGAIPDPNREMKGYIYHIEGEPDNIIWTRNTLEYLFTRKVEPTMEEYVELE
jgi:hypothetical protein